MATKEFPLVPEATSPIHTQFRRIQTSIPVPQSVPILEKLRQLEPRSMGGQPPILWDRGEGAKVYDSYGNCWLDFSAGVLVTSSGHGHPKIKMAIAGMAQHGMYHAYCFPTEIRAALVEKLTSLLPAPLKRVFLLTTGSEATECAIKLARTQGLKMGGNGKNILVSFQNGFHGRTMGAQLAGGAPALKSWLGDPDSRFVQVPYPDGFRQRDISFQVFLDSLASQKVDPARVCGVIGESYQGGNACLIPADYAQALRKWCDQQGAVLILDEIQAGFGRTGRLFGFEHMGIVPDLVCCGKGISGGMPLSAVLGTEELMNLYGPGEMTSTHSANPVCSAAALANLEVIEEEKLVENSAALAPLLAEGCRKIQQASNGMITFWNAAGLVCCLQFTHPGTTDPNPDPAWQFVWEAVKRGVMLFAPVGLGGSAVKLNPPLIIQADALMEGLAVLEDVAQGLN
jgi:4-aminobutyrate aminotransferase-like enzyme